MSPHIVLILNRVCQKSDFQCVDELLKEHASLNCFVALIPEDRQRIIVRRKHIWPDARRAFKQPGFNDCIGVNVTFIGEPGQDAGGPTREFFRLVLKNMSEDGSLFTGPSCARALVHNVLALQHNDFHVIGHVISLSLWYGGGAPHFFSRSVVAYLLNEPLDVDMVDEVPDYQIRSSLHKVC